MVLGFGQHAQTMLQMVMMNLNLMGIGTQSTIDKVQYYPQSMPSFFGHDPSIEYSNLYGKWYIWSMHKIEIS